MVKRHKYKLHLDLMFEDCYILNHAHIKLHLIRSKDKFAIVSPMDNTSSKVKLDIVNMMIRKVQVNSVIQATHANALEMGTAKYPVGLGECKTCTVSSDTRSHAEENLYSGEIPKCIFTQKLRFSFYLIYLFICSFTLLSTLYRSYHDG